MLKRAFSLTICPFGSGPVKNDHISGLTLHPWTIQVGATVIDVLILIKEFIVPLPVQRLGAAGPEEPELQAREWEARQRGRVGAHRVHGHRGNATHSFHRGHAHCSAVLVVPVGVSD